MKYINTKTKATIDTSVKISGGNWALVEEKKRKSSKKTQIKKDDAQ